jgi:hypothetical protein
MEPNNIDTPPIAPLASNPIQSPAPAPRSHFLRNILITIVALIVLAGGFRIWDSTQTINRNQPDATQDTSTWKTYTNSQYGFEFKYPSNWYLDPRTGYPLEFSNYPNASDLERINTPQDLEVIFVCIDLLSSSSTSCVNPIKSFQNGTTRVAFKFGKDSYDQENVMEEMTTSFKFNSAISTTVWRTYSNNKFSFSYPTSYAVDVKEQPKDILGNPYDEIIITNNEKRVILTASNGAYDGGRPNYKYLSEHFIPGTMVSKYPVSNNFSYEWEFAGQYSHWHAFNIMSSDAEIVDKIITSYRKN